MTVVDGLFVFLFYAAIIVLVVGIGMKIKQYANTPAPLKIPTTPAPVSKPGVWWRMFTEVVFFNSLFKSTKWTWIFGWLFHFALLLAFFRHLRYALPPDNFLMPIVSLELVQAAGKYGGYAMVIGLLGLIGRRIFVDRVRYISSPSDFAMLLLILGIAVSGLFMTFVDHADIVQLKAFVLGLFYFDWQPLPDHGLLITHLALVLFLAFIFPMSKLLHAPGIFFSPTRNQVDNPRERRHIADWAKELEANS